jgi:hypothetical protein
VTKLLNWLENVISLAVSTVRVPVRSLAPTMQIYSDASDTSYGGFVQGDPNLRFHGTWTHSESLTSSTWRELAAVF